MLPSAPATNAEDQAMSRRLSRRRFLQTAAATPLLTPLLRADDKKPASERLQIGVIGVAGRGAENINELIREGSAADIVALCDVDESRKDMGVQKARDRFPKAAFYQDFRKLIEHKGLDAVLIATPDHTHAVATLAALRAGLHVYCEKPLTHTVKEARLVAETAKKMKRVTQMGTQIHAQENYRRVVELIQAGAVGKVGEVHCWVGTSYSNNGRPKEEPPVPKGLDYDLWLGPTVYRPYHPSFVPYYWRSWWAFGGGALADMACHHTDLPFWALKLRAPTKVSAEGEPAKADAESPAKAMVVHYEFPERDGLPPVKLTWYHGGKRPALFQEGKLPKWGDGTLFVGEKGMLLAGYNARRLIPEELADIKVPEKLKIANSIGHHKEWVEACKSGGPTTCNFDYGGALTESALLGNVAYRSGKPITWDAQNLTTGDAAADAYLHKEYRKGWSLD
jgi:predicted dehydrogenase